MGVDRTQTSGTSASADQATAAELVERLSHFDGPPEQFLLNLLAVQCHIAAAAAGAILRLTPPEGRVDVVAVYPPVQRGATAPVWLAQSVESAQEVMAGGQTAVKPLSEPHQLYGEPAARHVVLVPIRGQHTIRGLSAFVVETRDGAALAAARERLELTASLLSLYEMRLTLQRRHFDLRRLQMAVETLSAVNEPERFAAAAMAFCNETAARWQCERAALGFLRGRYVHLKALSHTEKFSRKMKLVQDIEAAMEECLDQDLEVVHPSSAEATFVSRAAKELALRQGPSAVFSLPLRREGKAVAVLTLERSVEQPFTIDEAEALRLTCDLCTARLVNLHEQDRWFGARAAAGLRKKLGVVVGPKHTWIKVAAVAILGAVCFLIFGQGKYQAEAPFVFEATERRVVPAPFDGFLETVSVSPGDAVKGGETVLATLVTSELRLQLATAQAERVSYLKQAAAAMRDAKTAQAQIAQAQADGAAARIGLLEYKINQARIVAPVTGLVVTGDLKRQLGAPAKTGDTLFEVAPIEHLRAELYVPEDQIAEVEEWQEGELAEPGHPELKIGFVVERVNPVAEVVKQRNIFKVRVKLSETRPWMRPGMEGVAKITLGKRSYGWLWTRRLVNWVRMKLWI